MDESQSDSAYSTSKGSKSSSSRSPKPSSDRRESRKRKIQENTNGLQPKMKRVKSFYSDHYRKLFNETVNEIASQDLAEDDTLPANQIGVTSWSSEEKAVLFNVLSKKGLRNLEAIANEVSSKSESQVYLYLELLEKAAMDQYLYEPVRNLFKPYEIDAAVEISDECCAALNHAANALSVLQRKEEERREKLQHHKLSILTPNLAKWVFRRLRAGEEGEAEVSNALPAATLMNLQNFLTVSKRFFMNSGEPEKNWRTHTEKRQSPTIMYTAFSDFHTLVTSITRRLVQSCIFIAISRLRATTAPGHYIPQQHVKRRDVVAALNVLGMKTNPRAFWAGTARKCGLRVYENVRRRQVTGQRYSYDEIEDLLNSSEIERRERSRALSLNSSNDSIYVQQEANELSPENNSSASDSTPPDPTSTDEDDSDDSSDDINLPQPPFNGANKHTSNQERQDQAQEAYTEALDQRASRKEENRLWEMLGENPAEKMNNKDVPLPKAPYPPRKTKEDLIDWTTWVDYAGEWETNQSPVPESSFAKNRQLGRKRALNPASTNSGSSEDRHGGEQSADEAPSSDDSLKGKPSGAMRSSGMDLDVDSDEVDDDGVSVRSEDANGLEVGSEAEDSDHQLRRPGAEREMLSDREESSDDVREDMSKDEGQRNLGIDDSVMGNDEGSSTTDDSTED